MDQPSSPDSNAITLRIRFKSASLDDFIARYGADVSPGGIFIRTKQPVEVGTALRFVFSLGDGSPLLAGTGTVAWVRESDPARANNIPGMGLRFDKLSPDSQHTHQLVLAEKAHKEGKTAGASSYPPTTFVAPASRISSSSDAGHSESASPNAAFAGEGPAAAAEALKTASRPLPWSVSAGPTSARDSGEFSEGEKTAISERPPDYYLRETRADPADAVRPSQRKSGEEAASPSLRDESSAALAAAVTRSAPPPESVIAASTPDSAAGEDTARPEPSRPAEPAATRIGEEPPSDAPRGVGKVGGVPSFAELMAIGNAEERSGAPTREVVPELSAGVPLEETAPEKTAEVSIPAPADSLRGPETLDLGTGVSAATSADSAFALRRTPGRSRQVVVIGIAVGAAAAAFLAVYLVKAKPRRDQGQPETAQVRAVVNESSREPGPGQPKEADQAPLGKPAAPARLAESDKPGGAAQPGKAGEKGEGRAQPGREGDKASAQEPEKVVSVRPARRESETPRSGKGKAKAGEELAGNADGEVYRLVIRSTPVSAEVLIDGEYFSRTPCERRILDPTKSFAVTIRKKGYEQHERRVGPSDVWTKKGDERLLNVTVVLKKAKPGETHTGAAFGPPEEEGPRPATTGKGEPAPAETSGAALAGGGVGRSGTATETTAAGSGESEAQPKPAQKLPLPPAKPLPSLDDLDKPKE